MQPPVRVAVTGAAGNIAYALLFRIAAGDMLGPNQPVILQLLEIPPALPALDGVVMELHDCAFPLLAGIQVSADAAVAFADADYALLVGSKPRTADMERKDLLHDNGKIFAAQGKALNDHASKHVKVLVVGNPANTNALIAAANAPDLPPEQITAMMRLDHNRAKAQLAEKLSAQSRDITNMTMWGNHSATQYPDLSHARVNNKPIMPLVAGNWTDKHFIPTVQQRGTAIIRARGASSAASAAAAAIDHIRDWVLGTPENDWVSMAIASDGSYGIDAGLIYSFPVRCQNGHYEIVQGLSLSESSYERMRASETELQQEREAVKELM